MNFCPHHQTAFADIEVEHEDEAGKLWEVGISWLMVRGDYSIDDAAGDDFW